MDQFLISPKVRGKNWKKSGPGQEGAKRKKRKTKCKQAKIQSFFSILNSQYSPSKEEFNSNPDTPPSDVSTSEAETPPSTVSSSESTITSPPSESLGVCKRKLCTQEEESESRIPNPLKQLYLDLGQKDFGKQITCSICGMLFVHGLSEDEKQHKRVCQDFQKGILFQVKDARVVKATKYVSIVEIRPSDTYSLRRKLERVLKIAQIDLGSSISLKSISSRKTAYLFVYKKRVVGMATAEIISKAFVLEKTMFRSKKERKAMVGIHQIWVHRNHRRKGIASELVDSIRTKFVYGLLIPPEMLAFSSPTQLGSSFAKSYAKKNGNISNEDAVVLVYDCLNPV